MKETQVYRTDVLFGDIAISVEYQVVNMAVSDEITPILVYVWRLAGNPSPERELLYNMLHTFEGKFMQQYLEEDYIKQREAPCQQELF